MKGKWVILIIGIVSVLFIVLILIGFISGTLYVIDESQQAVIIQFGRPVRGPIKTAGLHFKMPFLQEVHYFEKRIMDWDGYPNQIPTKDKKYIWVDTTARWRIYEPLRFLRTVDNELGAQIRLDDIINAATRDAVTNHLLIETIRNSNRIIDEKQEGEEDAIISMETPLERIDVGRRELTRLILEKAKSLAHQYGIDIIDVRVKRINYVEDVRNTVYDRMIAERKRAAEKYRSEGQGRFAEIQGLVTKELKQISSEAFREAQTIMGHADAEASNIYAQAYSEDPDFYSFLKTIETYEDTIDGHSTIILTTDSDYYKLLKSLE
ncbi:MAG: hypothetical protein AMJ95_00140 [Omnitrophica WOR_2 bacterium SM23_72]|nr:MAG: hypothetical protein AMJ95_00140 [Omnitrophica WOR_2 bacterium SM23_72]